jgi:DNA mismatch repair protein MutS
VQFNRVHGFYIEVTQGQLDKVPDDYRRRQTLKNAERFITPELKAFEDKALSAQERALAREKWLYEQLLDALQPHVPCLTRLARALATLDALCALAERSLTLNWCRPQFMREPGIEITQGRHPVVEARLAETTAAPSSPTTRAGPQAAHAGHHRPQHGRQVDLHAPGGAGLPAGRDGLVRAGQACRLGPMDAIHTRIGAADDLANAQSTFMLEMTEAAQILHGATAQSLVLMDEIGRGTSTFDGLALAVGIAAHLHDKTQAFTLFATHYFELTEFPAKHHARSTCTWAPPSRARHRVPARDPARPGQPQLRHPGGAAGRHARRGGQPCAPRAGRAGAAAGTGREQVDLFAPPPAAEAQRRPAP